MDNRNTHQPQAVLPPSAPHKAAPIAPCPHTVKALTNLAQVARQVI